MENDHGYYHVYIGNLHLTIAITMENNGKPHAFQTGVPVPTNTDLTWNIQSSCPSGRHPHRDQPEMLGDDPPEIRKLGKSPKKWGKNGAIHGEIPRCSKDLSAITCLGELPSKKINP